ncbi:MAG: hypothetical protein AMXMBFR34_54280 [Myxococcaceae bacterium]
MSNTRILLLFAAVTLAGAIWFALSSDSDNGGAPARPTTSTQGGSQPPQGLTAVGGGSPTGAGLRVAVVAPPDSGPAAVEQRDWKSRWDGIPLDEAGRSLSGRGQAKTFNHALHAAIREELQRCAAARPQQVEQQISVELFVEATDNGYSVVGAEASPDSGLDSYTLRCFELAFETQLEIPDAGTTGGVLYHFAYPILLPGPSGADAGTD